MIRRICAIVILSYFAFMLEFSLYNAFGAWGKPELLILVVVFFNLYLGIRFGIIAAIVAGVLKDALSIEPFGTYLFVYIAGAYVTSLVRQYLYQPGSRLSRAVVAFFAVVSSFVAQSLLMVMGHEVRVDELFFYLLIPQLVTTMIVATTVFHKLRDISVFLKLKN